MLIFIHIEQYIVANKNSGVWDQNAKVIIQKETIHHVIML